MNTGKQKGNRVEEKIKMTKNWIRYKAYMEKEKQP